MRRPLLAILVLTACAQSPRGAPDLEGLRADPGALARARGTIQKECQGSGSPTAECCQARTSEGDALQAAGDRQAAYDSYEATRTRCLTFHPVRRRLFLLRRAPPPKDQPEPLAMEVSVNVIMSLELGPDLRLAWFAPYFDGEPIVMPRRMSTTSGAHEVAVEIYVEPRTGSASADAIRLDVRREVVLPRTLSGEKHITGGVQLTLRDRGGPGALSERVQAEIQTLPFTTLKAMLSRPAGRPADNPAPARKMLAPNIASALLITSPDVAVPPDIKQKTFWAIFRVCVTTEGAVEEVSLVSTSNPGVVGDLTTAIEQWRYRPYLQNGQPVAFCAPVRVSGRPN